MGDFKSTNSNPKDYTPGWNDPPIFSYDSQAAHSSAQRKTNVLTKRVAFPLQPSSSNTANNPVIDPTLPLTFKSNLPPPPCSSTPSEDRDSTKEGPLETQVTDDLSKEEVLSNVLSNVKLVINELALKESFLEQADDIQKKLDLLEKLWKEDKLLKDIHIKVYKLTNALISQDIKTADYLQAGLMVDHASLCSSWISAFRLLIHFMSDEKR